MGCDEDKPIQVDESLFQGTGKYKRGRLRLRDRNHPRERESQRTEQESTPEIYIAMNNKNHGERVEGLWLFDVCKDKSNVRFHVVDDRKAQTLNPIILETVQQGSTIVSDEWKAFSRLSTHILKHETVNHSRNYINPLTRFLTQAIERAWVDAKVWIKRARGARPLLQSHLDEVSWKKSRKSNPEGIMTAFWADVRRVFE